MVAVLIERPAAASMGAGSGVGLHVQRHFAPKRMPFVQNPCLTDTARGDIRYFTHIKDRQPPRRA